MDLIPQDLAPNLHARTAALFDLDGTLLDTLDDLAASMNAALSSHGLLPVATDAYRGLIGTGALELARLASRSTMIRAGMPEAEADSSSRELSHRIREDFRTAYAAGWNRSTRPYRGVSEALRALRTAGIPVGVLSNKPDAFTRQLVSHFFPDIDFSTVRGEREGEPRKPDPLSAAESLRAFGCPAASIAYLGDSGNDMSFAKNCGFLPVGVLWGFRDKKELLASGAAVLLDRPAHIPQVFGLEGGR